MVIGSVNFYTTRTVSHREKIERRKGGTFFQKHQCTPFVTTTKWLVVWSCFFSSSNLKKKVPEEGKRRTEYRIKYLPRVYVLCHTKKKKWTTIIQHENSINYYHFPQLFLLVFGSYQSDLPMCVCVIAHTNQLNQIFLLPFGIFKLWYK